jgi:hypothetical protein
MRRFVWIPICLVVLLIPAAVMAGGSEGFNGVVNSIESHYHVRAARIPFLGLISFISARATHSGVSNIHVADFEHFSAAEDGAELNAIVEEKLGPGWERIIRETNRHGSEQTLIYIHPEGRRMGVFVLDQESNELNVVQVSVDPDHLDEDIGHYRHHHDTAEDHATSDVE